MAADVGVTQRDGKVLALFPARVSNARKPRAAAQDDQEVCHPLHTSFIPPKSTPFPPFQILYTPAAFHLTFALTFNYRLHENTVKQWDILEKRLSLPGQQYIALQDRPTLADLSYFPFAMPWMFKFLGVDIRNWPAIERWSRKMLARQAVKDIMERAPKFGH